jgi:hypothetical protein
MSRESFLHLNVGEKFLYEITLLHHATKYIIHRLRSYLFVTQALDGVEAGGFARGPNAEDETDAN